MDLKRNQKLNDSLLIFYTGITRNANEVLSDQQSNMKNNVEIVKEIAGLALSGKDKLEHGDIDELGLLLHQNWGLKKLLSDKISNENVDKMYKIARDNGAIGGKLLGAGAGGFMLLYIPDGKRENVRESLKGYRELPFTFDKDVIKIIYRK
jgi:D-glycero-alpha-D-manno-heptose-7-phosphate kinase